MACVARHNRPVTDEPRDDPAEAVEASTGEPGATMPRTRRMVDLTPLRQSPAFARLWFGTTISTVGTFVTVTAVGLQVYDITASSFMVGLVGGVALVPVIVAGLWGGMLADVLDRRRLSMATQAIAWLSVLVLVALSAADAMAVAGGGARVSAWWFIAVATVNSVAATITSATRRAIIGRILPPHLVSRAAALNGIGFGLPLTLGPAIAGVVAAAWGLPWTFAIDAVLFTFGFLGIWSLPPQPRLGEPVRAGWPVLREGLAFLRRAPNIRMSFIVDIIAMGLGRPYALFPAIAALVVGGGSLTVGALTTAGAIGTVLTSVFSGPVAGINRHGVAIARAITVYGGFVVLFGAATLAFSLVDHDPGDGLGGIYWPALVVLALAMAGMGASDEVSAIFRQTMMISAVPDEMRGRLQGVFVVVVTGGPRLGDVYAGALATALALWSPMLFGGLLIIVLIAVLTRVQRSFREYDDRAPTP